MNKDFNPVRFDPESWAKAGKDAGASFTAYTFIRLNGAIKLLFHDWLYKNFPDRADKVWHLIEGSHDGKVNDSRWGVRMRGEGNIAQIVAQQYKKYGKLYGMNAERWEEGPENKEVCFKEIVICILDNMKKVFFLTTKHFKYVLHTW